MKKGTLNHTMKLKLSLPAFGEVSIRKFLMHSGTFVDGDLRVNRDGVQIVPESETEAPPPIQPTDEQLALAEIDMIKVIGKGTGGIVQLV